MAHTNESQVITDQDAVPNTKVSQIEKGGAQRSAYAYMTLTPATAAQTNAFVRVPARARLVSVGLQNVTMGDGSVEVGLFRPNDGIAIGSAVLSAAVALTANEGNTDVIDAMTPLQRSQDLKSAFSTEVGTASATNDAEYDIVLSVVTVSTGAATAVGMEVKYVMPE